MENENVLKFGLGIKIWCVISILGSIFSSLTNLIYANYSVAVACIATVIFYIWLLLSKKRIAFYLIVFVAVARLIIDLIVLKTPMAFLGLGNCLITYAFLHKYWKQMK